MRERWFGATGRQVPELAAEGDVDVDGALVVDGVGDETALRGAFDAGTPVVVRAASPEAVKAALARPEVSCVLVPAGSRRPARTRPHRADVRMKILRLDEVEGVPVFGTLVWKPVRRELGVTSFGINAYTAAGAGDEVVEDHTEGPSGHEEIYAVVSGHATFTVDGEEIDAPAGTLVFLDDPTQRRAARAVEAGTTVLAIGGKPGAHEISAWEYIFPSLPARNAEDWDTARRIARGGARGGRPAGDPLPPRVRRGARRQRRSRPRGAADRGGAAAAAAPEHARGGGLRLHPRRPALPGLTLQDWPRELWDEYERVEAC